MAHGTFEENKHEKEYCDINSCACYKGIEQIKYVYVKVGFNIIKI